MVKMPRNAVQALFPPEDFYRRLKSQLQPNVTPQICEATGSGPHESADGCELAIVVCFSTVTVPQLPPPPRDA